VSSHNSDVHISAGFVSACNNNPERGQICPRRVTKCPVWVIFDGLGSGLRLVDVCFYPQAPDRGQVSSVAFGRTPVIQTPKLGARIMRYELADYEWVAIKPMLPNKPRGVPRVNDRRVLDGIFWVLRSGAPWRDLPEAFGSYTTCYNRFVRWRGLVSGAAL
jgi:Putative transposase of IS4/5 family (DUF4096)